MIDGDAMGAEGELGVAEARVDVGDPRVVTELEKLVPEDDSDFSSIIRSAIVRLGERAGNSR